MLTRLFWPYLRRHVPVSWYPLLGIIHRLDEARAVRRLAAVDRGFLATHEVADLPPPQMRFRVFGECDANAYLAGSEDSRRCLEAGLRLVGKGLADFHTALDFGCGCGRTLRAFRDRESHWRLFATDVDPAAIEWCQSHLDFVPCNLNGEIPPLPYADGQFDLAWAISVFTHLDEDRQFQWLAELKRIMGPGGILLATVHGRFFWEGLPVATVRDIEASGFLFARTEVDRGLLPDWYQTAWHAREYVEHEWTRFFNVLAYIPQGMHNRQDLVVLQRPNS